MYIPGYRFYGNNRKEISSKRGGGVAVLVKNVLCAAYSVKICCADTDGILGLEFTHKDTLYTTVIVSNCLPPCNSEFGKDPEKFYSRLLLLCYE